MTHALLLQRTAIVAAIAMFGAGCAGTPRTSAVPNIPATMAFGKLPSLLAAAPSPAPSAEKSLQVVADKATTNVFPAADAISAPSAAPAAGAFAPSVMIGSGDAGAAVARSGTTVRPIPSPYPTPQPVPVEYSIDAPLPSWGAAGDVLLANATLPSAATVGPFARGAGLPQHAFEDSDAVTTLNLQWRDADKIQWTFDAGSGNVSFWKETATPAPADGSTPSQLKDGEIVRIADAFLDAHGFSAIRQSGGTVEKYPQILPMMEGAGAKEAPSYPCPVMKSGTVSAAGGAAPAIWPRPCGWWPQTATVVYAAARDGKPVTDAYGNASQRASVSVNLTTKDVSGGNLQLEQNVDRSSYPLIDAASATKRLQSGGQNPVWPWGSETRAIKVRLTKIEIVWIRYDGWQNGTTQTYFIPGLLATGTVDRGVKGSAAEDERTMVPLVDDSAFTDNGAAPAPVQMMKGASVPAATGGAATRK